MSGPSALPPEIEAALGRLRDAAQALEARSRSHDPGAEDEHARAARSGALGHEWQVVQQRIDLGQTTLSAVFDGSDTTPAARELRALARRTLSGLRTGWQEQDEQGQEPSPAARARAVLAEQQAHRQAVTDEIRRALQR